MFTANLLCLKEEQETESSGFQCRVEMGHEWVEVSMALQHTCQYLVSQSQNIVISKQSVSGLLEWSFTK